MATLYRSGTLVGSVSDSPAPEIANIFDVFSKSLGLPMIRSNAVYFNLTKNDAMHWSGQRYLDGLDTNIYKVDVEAEVHSYELAPYDKFASTYRKLIFAMSSLPEGETTSPELEDLFTTLREAVCSYHASKRIVNDEDEIFATRREVLVDVEIAETVSWALEYEAIYE